MAQVLVDIIAGARPNFMKIAPIIHALQAHQKQSATLQFRLIHTGQHYDAKMSGDFFTQLNIPEPDVNLEVGSGTQAEQTGEIMRRYEALLMMQRSQLCLVVGDVTSTMACAITAQKMGVDVAHVEAGIRSGDWSMPEEINRMVTDAVSNYFFTTSETAGDNLQRSGVTAERIFFVGNTMIDTLLANLPKLQEPECWQELALVKRNYVVLTLHRPSNVDNSVQLRNLLLAVAESCGDNKIIFPVHPRTRSMLAKLDNLPEHIYMLEPQGYHQFIYLIRDALAVITDSGGITEEATVLSVPCLTLRDTTERPETVTMGTNQLLGTDPSAITPAMKKIISGQWKRGTIPPLWDGKTAQRIVAVLGEVMGGASIMIPK